MVAGQPFDLASSPDRENAQSNEKNKKVADMQLKYVYTNSDDGGIEPS